MTHLSSHRARGLIGIINDGLTGFKLLVPGTAKLPQQGYIVADSTRLSAMGVLTLLKATDLSE